MVIAWLQTQDQQMTSFLGYGLQHLKLELVDKKVIVIVVVVT